MLFQSFLSWLAFPVYVWQGVGVRLKTERMLPAEGRVLHRIAGEGEPFNLLVIGDSSAASVGVGRTEDGLAARLAALVSERTGRPVEWRAAGFNSATAGQLRDFVVPNLAPESWTHIVLAVGTNDMKNFHTARRFKAEFGGLLYAVRAKWPEALVLWSPVIEMTRVPALPSLLARVLEIRARIVNRVGAGSARNAAQSPPPACRLRIRRLVSHATASTRRKLDMTPGQNTFCLSS
jgi:lysophospholipase L1-like esterase